MRKGSAVLALAALALCAEGGAAMSAPASKRFALAFVSSGRLAYTDADGRNRRATKLQVNGFPVWSRDGRRLAFFSPGAKARLWVTAPGRRARAVTPSSPYSCGWLDWSPSGRRIVYTLNGDCGGFLVISAVDADGTHPRNLAGVSHFDAVWSPDGRKLLFGGFDKGAGHLFTMRPDGRGARRIPLVKPASPNGYPSRPHAVWSRNEQRIYYLGSVGGHDETLVVSNADGSDARDLVPRVSRVFSFDLSPRGGRVALSADDGRRRDIFVVDADGGNFRQLTDVRRVVNDDPRWSPDGKKLAFVRREGCCGRGNDQIYVMNADGSAQTNISDNSTEEAAPAWRP